jgi:CRP-like cAMP-binding protein
MLRQPRAAERFKDRLREWIQREFRNAETISVAKHGNVYNIGDQDQKVYIIESGQIKLLMISPGGRESLLDIYTTGDVFGELCLAGSGERLETATAMVDSILKGITCSNFRRFLGDNSLFDSFVQYLVVRIAYQQQVIANLMTTDSEHRLGEALLMLARKCGKQDPYGIRIEHKITHEDLSEMVGVTRPWISRLLHKFRELGLIEISPKRFLTIKEEKLTSYLAEIT